MKILVTGANGLLGQKLTYLFDQDPTIELTATAKSKLSITLKRGAFRELDITRIDQVTEVINSIKPDVIVNTAAMTNVDGCELEKEACWLANVTAVKYLVEHCSKNSIHLVHVSTDFIFDGTQGPLDELARPNPVNYYGASKLEGERIIQDNLDSFCILRTILVYGVSADMSRSNIVLWVKKSLENGKRIFVVNDQWRTPTLAEDLAQGCYLAAKKKAKGIFNISGKDLLSPYDIAIKTSRFFNLDSSLIVPTDSIQFKQPAKRPLKTGFIIDKAVKELGYQPRSFEEGLQVIKEQLAKVR